ncbi:LysR family transcriptional regulator [Streptomyces caniferus]|uniref:helix-turn-helix domain-containing protein n=1 Tax=Streptomyces caniferus TaxID=285557 RepID=UPI00371A7F6D
MRRPLPYPPGRPGGYGSGRRGAPAPLAAVPLPERASGRDPVLPGPCPGAQTAHHGETHHQDHARRDPVEHRPHLLTALDALLEEQSVTAAADRLGLSGPAMSRALGRMRRTIGDPVLVRAGRRMVPTPARPGDQVRGAPAGGGGTGGAGPLRADRPGPTGPGVHLLRQ